jgi:hypothetical protein
MMRRIVLICCLWGIALGSFGEVAGAACSQSDATGTWNVYIGGGGDSGMWWERCELKIAADGTIKSGTYCHDDTGFRSTVVGGRLSLATSCVGNGTLKLKRGTTAVNNYIRHGTMDRGKTTFAGVGDSSFGDGFVFNAVKK